MIGVGSSLNVVNGEKLATPVLDTEIDTLVGTLDYGKVRVAKAPQ